LGIGSEESNAGMSIRALFKLGTGPKKKKDCIGLVWYWTGSGFVSFFKFWYWTNWMLGSQAFIPFISKPHYRDGNIFEIC
jgi:hypothetical protein